MTTLPMQPMPDPDKTGVGRYATIAGASATDKGKGGIATPARRGTGRGKGQAALLAARVAVAGTAAPTSSHFTETSLETPGSCMVTP